MEIYFNITLQGIYNAQVLLNKISNNTQFDSVRDSLYYHLFSLIHSAGDIYARLKNKKLLDALPSNERNFFLSFIYLNNQIKHDPDLNIIYYEVYGSTFPMRLPFRFGSPGVYWADFQDHGKSKEAKRLYYDLYLNHKDISYTLKQLEEVILKYKNIIN